jgi:hypothetical protein
MRDLVVLGLLTSSTHWLVARSEIARPLWSRTRGWLAKLLACAGCSGWWLGLGYGVLGLRPVSHGWRGIVLAGVLGTILTPIFEAILIWGLDETAISIDAGVPEPSPETSSKEDQITPLDRPQR